MSACKKAQEVVTNGNDAIKLKTEVCNRALFSILMAVCQGCGKQFSLHTSSKQSNGQYDINVRAVWGYVASGSGATDLNEILGSMNLPPMHEAMFSRIEPKIGTWWVDALKEEIAKAGAEEKRIAVEKDDFQQGIPAITFM